MDQFPESVLEIIARATREHLNDIPRAIECALRQVQGLRDYQSLVDGLVKKAVQELIYTERGLLNRQMKSEAGEYGGPAKVKPGESEGVKQAFASVYSYFIAGKTLGEMLGEELVPTAESEENKSAGHLFNARLCRALDKLVPEGKRVREMVPAKKLDAIFRRMQRDGEAPAA